MLHFSLKNLAFCVVLLVMVPVSASAAVIVRSGDNVSVTNDQIVGGDFYASGGVVSVSGQVDGDMYTAAGSFTSNGEIKGDLTIAAGTAQVHAPVGDDVRVVGGEVVIAGPVGGDVVVFGGLLKVLSTASIQGDILFFGGDLQVLGPVEGSIMGTGESVRIDAHVGQSVDMKTGSISIGDKAEILGDVRYTSTAELTRSQNATILGEVVQNSVISDVSVSYSYEAILISFIIFLFSALVVQLVFRPQLARALPSMTQGIGISGLIGVSFLVVAPLIVVVLLASMLGSLVGIIALALFVLIVALAFAFSGIFAGALLQKYLKQTPQLNALYTIGGVALLQVLMLVPVVGISIVFIFYFISIGTLVRALYVAFRS